MLLYNYGVGNGQPLARALAYLFGCKKWIEDFLPDVLGNARAGITNSNL